MVQDTSSTTLDHPSRTWTMSLAIVCLGIIAYGYLYSKNTTSNFVFLFVSYLPIGLVIWAIFHVAVGRKQGKKNAGLSFAVIFGALIASALIGYSQQKSAATQAATEMQKHLTSIVRSATDAQGLPQRIEEKLDTTPKTKGELGEVERFMKTFMNKVASQRNDYLLEIDAIGWGKILDAERVKQDKTLIESKIMIQKAKDITSKHRAQMNVLLENVSKDISNLNVSENWRRDMARDFNRGMAQSRPEIDALWDVDAKIISEVENIFVLLSARNGTWRVQNGKILFERVSDLNAVNSHMAAIQELASKQEANQKRSTEEVNNILSRLKN